MKTALVLLLFALVPAFVGLALEPEPTDRYIHVASFRYGKDPAVIRANRGDRLHLTFSARDTGHSFFLEEFGLDVKVRPGTDEVDVVDPARPEAGLERMREVTIVANPPGPLGFLKSRFQFRCHVWCGPMHAFEHGTLVLWPNPLLCAALGLLVGIPLVGLVRMRRRRDAPAPAGIDLFERFPRLRRIVRARSFQFSFTGASTLFLYIVILTTIFGTQNAGRNLGVMLLWVVWLFVLIVVMTPLGGRVWCLLCPLPLLGETLQRGTLTGVRLAPEGTAPDPERRHNNRYRGLNLPWPERLSGTWPRVLAILALGTFTVALVAKPRVTGFVLLGMLALATVLALIFERRAFCRFLCPISAFLGVYAKTARLALRPKDTAVCARCDVKTCLKGSMKGWGCPFGLNVEEIRDSDDCGLCSECVKTCPLDNIALEWRPLAVETSMRTIGRARMSIVMLVLALAYCVVYLGPWPAVRDWVNILDKGNWGAFAVYAAGLWTLALVVFPALVRALSSIGRRLSGADADVPTIFRGSAGALVPIGLAAWIAFVIPMLLVNVTFVLQSLSDPFGWGWDFLGTRNTPWQQVLPGWIPWMQAAVVLLGVTLSLRNNLRNWRELAKDDARATMGAAPIALLLVTLGAGLIIFFAG